MKVSKAEAEQVKPVADKPSSPQPPGGEDIWLQRSEVRAKDYSKMSVGELIQELESLTADTPEANGARQAIGWAMAAIAERITESELPKMSGALETSLDRIQSDTPEANWARWAIGVAMEEIAERIGNRNFLR